MVVAMKLPLAGLPVNLTRTRSPTLIPLMLVTLPVTLVAEVTAPVTELPCPATVIDVLLTAVTGPASSIWTWPPAPPGCPPETPPPPMRWLGIDGRPLGAEAEGAADGPCVSRNARKAPATPASTAIRATATTFECSHVSRSRSSGRGGLAGQPPATGWSPGQVSSGQSPPGQSSSGQSPGPPFSPCGEAAEGGSAIGTPSLPRHGLGTVPAGAQRVSGCLAGGCTAVTGRRNRRATAGRIDLASADASPADVMCSQPKAGSQHVLPYLPEARASPQDAPGRGDRAGPGRGGGSRGHRDRGLGRGEEGPGRRAQLAVRGGHRRHGDRQGPGGAHPRQRAAAQGG